MDNQLTKAIEDFLAIAKPTDEEVRKGATLLLRVDPMRSRSIYNSAMIRPQSMLKWVQADLKKFLGIRQRGIERQDVARFNADAVKQVRETLARVPDTVVKTADKELKEALGNIPEGGVRGKRADHDSLPEEIKAIWDTNAERWKKMRQLHAQLEAMIAQPGYRACDGNELCYTLLQADNEIRNDYKRYDEWKPGKPKDDVETFTDNVRTIQNARSYITRGLQKKKIDDKTKAKMQEYVNTLVSLHQTIKPETAERLKAIGIVIPNA